MKILVGSYAFGPAVGGIESVSSLLARRWSESGHEVRVATETASPVPDAGRYPVVRQPTAGQMLRLLKWSDIYFQNNLSLVLLWPWLLTSRPLFITHQTWLWHTRSRGHPAVRLKLLASRLARNIAISGAVASNLPFDAVVVGNPYDEDQFHADAAPVAGRDLLFVGRLVRDKGCDLFLRALGRLRELGCEATATVVGDGPERPAAESLARKLGIAGLVEFRGWQRGNELAECYRAHRTLVVPSRWEEPFGIVALEGLASGCRLVVAASGGLPEAAGPGGRVFSKEDWIGLSEILREQIQGAPQAPDDAERSHLERHGSRRVAERYVDLFTRALPREDF